jgi:hypothetical protein
MFYNSNFNGKHTFLQNQFFWIIFTTFLLNIDL